MDKSLGAGWRAFGPLAAVCFAVATAVVSSVATQRSVAAEIVQQCARDGEFRDGEHLYMCSRRPIDGMLPPFRDERLKALPTLPAASAP